MSPTVALKALLADDGAATLVEYALALSLLSAAAIAVLISFGGVATTNLTTSSDSLTGVGRVTPGGTGP